MDGRTPWHVDGPLEPPAPSTEPAAQPGPAARRAAKLAEPLPEGSYADLYRGTQWDNLPRRAPRSLDRLKVKAPLIVGSMLVVLAIVVTASFMLVGQRKPSGLAGFRASTPAPTQLYIVPPPVASPPSPTPAGPTPQAWQTDRHHPVAQFISRMTSLDASYHVQSRVVLSGGGEQVLMAEVADVSGTDYSFALTMTTAANILRLAAVSKDGAYYVKLDQWPWVRRRTPPPAGGVLGNLGADSWARLEYVGPETVDGELLHHLRLPVAGWPGYADTMVFEISQAPATFSWDVWVEDDGRPRGAHLDAAVTMRVDGRDVAFAMTIDYTFSKFGGRITIQAPERFRQG